MTANLRCSGDRWLIVLAAVLAAIIFIFPLTVHFPLLDPDEGLHASIAQEMVERGDWLVPHFQGEPFLDKPILYFWCQSLSLKLFGMNEAALRMPGLIFGLLGAVTTGLIGWRMFGRVAGYISGIFYATMILPVALAQAAAHDVAIIPEINLAILFLWESDRFASKALQWKYAAVVGFILGLTILTKGLVGVALVAAIYGSYVIIRRRLSISLCLRALAALLLAALVASTWYITVEIKHPGYMYYYFIERHLLGFATGTQTHGEAPWWYYFPIILGGGLPWIGYIPVTLADAYARRGQQIYFGQKTESFQSGALVLLGCWVLCCVALFSAAHSKLITYIWPVFPAIAIVAAVGWAKLIEGTLEENERSSLLRTFWFSSVTGPIVLPLVVFVLQKVFDVTFSWQVWLAAVLAGLTPLVPLVFLKTKQWRAMLAASMLSTAAQFVVALTVVLPVVAEDFTARDIAQYFNSVGHVPEHLLVAEERLGSLIFYLDPALRSGLKQNQIDRLFKDQPSIIPRDSVIVLPEKRADKAQEYSVFFDAPYKTVGRYRLYDIRDEGRGARGESSE
ncbi:MAG TPA: glycosyltransferase family 39 protein [Thermoguttaceae bacterium]